MLGFGDDVVGLGEGVVGRALVRVGAGVDRTVVGAAVVGRADVLAAPDADAGALLPGAGVVAPGAGLVEVVPPAPAVTEGEGPDVVAGSLAAGADDAVVALPASASALEDDAHPARVSVRAAAAVGPANRGRRTMASGLLVRLGSPYLGIPNHMTSGAGTRHRRGDPMTPTGTATPDLDSAASFAAALRTGTLTEHREAEESPFMRDLMEGRADLGAYAALAGQLTFIYAELESLADVAAAADPTVAPFLDPRLARSARLAGDLDELVGEGWRERTSPGRTATAYVVRLREVTETWPTGFVAHHYLRYLGDVSGGQVVRTMLQRHYGAPDTAVTFYDFSDLGDIVGFKRSYRVLLDTAPWDAPTQERLVRETAMAYRLNRMLFDELGAARTAG